MMLCISTLLKHLILDRGAITVTHWSSITLFCYCGQRA